MNDDVLHGGTCQVWATGAIGDCNCQPTPAWRIRKEPEQQFPWRVFRLTGEQTYEPLMRCSSFEGALELVKGFTWLKYNGVRGSDSHV